MDNEDPPCRDTDPVNMNLVGKTTDTMAFTINFGGDDINQEQKVKKFERFAQRSSLRRVNSPRQEKTAEKEKCEDKERVNNNSLTVNLNKSSESEKKSGDTSPSKTSKESRITKERRSTVVLEKGMRSVSHNRLESRRKDTGGTRKSSCNEDALSHTGTYTMEEDVEGRKDLPDVAMIDKTRFIADWRAKHTAEDDSQAARRILPSAPSKDEITDESLKEVEKFLARSELTSNIRPGYKPSLKPLIDNSQTNGATSFRSLPYSTNYQQSRQEVGPRTSLRRKPVTGSSYLMSKTGSGNRSNSCLTSGQAEYKAWKTRKESVSKLVPSSVASSSSSSSTASSKQVGKLPLRMTQSLMSNNGNMKRSNSFHHENIQQQNRNGVKSTKESSPPTEPVTYRTSEDYYLDEDELFLPIFSPEDEPAEARHGRRDPQVSALDTLGTSSVPTLLTVCQQINVLTM